ncbi:MAG: hypothetical protein AAB316_09130 [Bacteroidota bacterium]
MATAELKNDLIRYVLATEDKSVLLQVKSFFSKIFEDEEDWWDTISEREKMLINRGLQQLDRGERIPHHVVRQETNRILTTA